MDIKKSIAKGNVTITSNDKETIRNLIKYFDITSQSNEYDILLNKDSDIIKKSENKYSFSDTFSGHGRWQFNLTLLDLGKRMISELKDNNDELLNDLIMSNFAMKFDIVDYEPTSKEFYESTISLSHKSNSDISNLNYKETNLFYLNPTEDNLLSYGYDETIIKDKEL